ncbi:hypothetical protein C8J56DRAFT_422092 [Mycena floridula]|nr:hypothetical protein C8J56DRAFT_422092 [Mycena floridula]
MPVLTRRAALAQKSILNVLPNELTTEIISLCDSRSQATLCRVSKHFQQLAYRRLYQIVYVDRDQQVIALEATLSANLQYGAWVRNLAIMGSRAGQDIITSILRSSTKLRELTVWWADAPDWKELSLPELSILKLGGIAHTDIITAFLNRHPKISHLAVPQYRSVHQSRRTLRVDLPSLTVFEGDLNTLGNSPKLRAVRHKLVALEDLDVLERFPTCQDIHLLVLSTVQHRVKDILKRLPLPNLKSCMLMDFHCIYSVNTKVSLSSTTASLRLSLSHQHSNLFSPTTFPG